MNALRRFKGKKTHHVMSNELLKKIFKACSFYPEYATRMTGDIDKKLDSTKAEDWVDIIQWQGTSSGWYYWNAVHTKWNDFVNGYDDIYDFARHANLLSDEQIAMFSRMIKDEAAVGEYYDSPVDGMIKLDFE